MRLPPDRRLLVREIETFLSEAQRGAVIEDGQAIFEVACAKFSLTTEREKCLLHLWSAERNVVRRVLDCERKHGRLVLKVQKFGAARPRSLEITADRDLRSPSAKRAQRGAYQGLLARLLAREFPGATIAKLSTSADLEHSFGPVHARALVLKGNSGFAAAGVNAAEDPAAIDSLLTTAVLWLHHCRERAGHMRLIEGVRLFAPAGKSAVLRARLAHLNHAAAKFELCEVHENDEVVTRLDVSDSGNLLTRLTQCPNLDSVESRFAAPITKIRDLVPEAEVHSQSGTEIAFRFRGLEFARARCWLAARSFAQQVEITFGAGQFETVLTPQTEALFAGLMARVRESRSLKGTRHDPLYRLQAERWLESMLRRDLSVIDSQLDPARVYSQVPAFAAGDRAVIDLLSVTRNGRLAVLELKADEDIHLPLQGLDYWSRVHWHQQRGEFRQFGYFSSKNGGSELSSEAPLLYLVTPALRVHPATDILLRYLSSRIDVTLVGINEKWRAGVEVVFRKRRSNMLGAKA